MAVMIPKTPREFDAASREGLMFEALSLLSDNYYVFHSFSLTRLSGNTITQEETDFLIFNPDKGIICIEAKAGRIRYENGQWLYSSGIPMKHGGPFNQANRNKFELMDYIKESRLAELLYRCKFLHAVWFPSLSLSDLEKINLPPEADKKLVLTHEALTEPEKYIDEIFNIDLPSKRFTNLSENDSNRLIKEILCPTFDVFPSVSTEIDVKMTRFHRLLKEQSAILNFLTEQQTAVINGAAGTGKTVIALEKAKRHAEQGERVLFLCFNVKLKEFLAESCKDENIAFYTIAGLACKLCNSMTPDYGKLKDKLESMYFSHNFPYRHIIVDEGQDFGMENIEETDILEMLRDIITDEDGSGGTFYIFYDRLQMIQSEHLPDIIENADCKLTLYKNCRNTTNIATTSLKPISSRKPKLYEGCVPGALARIHFANSPEKTIEIIDNTIESLKSESYSKIVILTCKTEEKSLLKGLINNHKYRDCLFTTCRRFKGLEAEAVILTDVDESTFYRENVLLFYVGASRARLKLEIVTSMDDSACSTVLRDYLNYKDKIRKPKKDFARALNATATLS